MAAFPHQPEDITADWLSSVTGGSVEGFELEQIGVGVGLLGRLYRVALTGHDVPASVVAKFPTLDQGARDNVAAPLGFYSNEISFYNEGAPITPINTPPVFAAEFEESSGDFVLLLEDVADRRCEDQTVGCEIESAQVAIDALAKMHAHWWNNDFAALPWIKSYVNPPYPQIIAAVFAQAWPVALDVIGDRLPGPIKQFGDRFPELVPWFLEEASEPPVTLCHGDYRLDNLFFAANDTQAPLTVLDWQICFKGNPGYDLGYFISQSLATETRRKVETDLIDRYRATSPAPASNSTAASSTTRTAHRRVLLHVSDRRVRSDRSDLAAHGGAGAGHGRSIRCRDRRHRRALAVARVDQYEIVNVRGSHDDPRNAALIVRVQSRLSLLSETTIDA